MNAKWCVSTLFIILALLGLSQEQTKASNQQIVLQFVDVELASETAHDDVLAVITKKLEVLGVDAVEVVKNDGTQLSIRYYSDIDADNVKAFLSEENQQSLSNQENSPLDHPTDEFPEQYSLVVSDLHQQVDNGFTLTGTLVSVQRQDNNRFLNPVILPLANTIGLEQDAIIIAAYKINRNIALAIHSTTKTIPEVRAGPYTCGNS